MLDRELTADDYINLRMDYPTQAEIEEELNLIFAIDPELYAFITTYEDGSADDWPADLDALEERMFVMGVFGGES